MASNPKKAAAPKAAATPSTANDDAKLGEADANAAPAADEAKVEPRKVAVPEAKRAESMVVGANAQPVLALADYAAERKRAGVKLITMKMPKAFRLALEDKRVVKFPEGVAEVPEDIANHWYVVKANGAKPYEK